MKTCHAGLANFPNSPYLLYLLGRTLSDIGETTNNTIKLNAGFRILDRTISLYPDFADAYIERGIILELLNDPVRAKEDYLKAESIEPGITRPYFEK